MTVTRKKRVHPMTQLVIWLGVALIAALLALVHVVGRLPSAQELESSHLAGMRVGYSMCLGFKESVHEEPRARLTSGGHL